jgi:hypothetical protein
MALQSSGQISASDVNTELGRSASSEYRFSAAAGGAYATINTASALYPNNSVPHQISEWYGYDHSASSYTNSHYLDYVRGNALKKSAFVSPFNLSTSQDLTVSVWVKQDATAAAVQNQIIWDMSTNNTTSSDRFFLQYDKNSNRFVIRFRTASNNFTLNYEIESNNSSMGLGTSASNLWSSTNRGNTNTDGWTLLTVVYDASQSTPANAFTFYWNATEVTGSSGAGAGSRTTRAVNYITLGNNNHNATTTAGGFVGGIDEVKIFTSALSSSNVTSLYNSGVIADSANSFSTGLHTEFTFDTDTSDSNGSFPTVQTSTATRTAH